MTISAKDFKKMSLEKRAELFPEQKCECGTSIEEHPDEQYIIDNKRVCSDCHFFVLGEKAEYSSMHPSVYGSKRTLH